VQGLQDEGIFELAGPGPGTVAVWNRRATMHRGMPYHDMTGTMLPSGGFFAGVPWLHPRSVHNGTPSQKWQLNPQDGSADLTS
jgi:hypothetical protein